MNTLIVILLSISIISFFDIKSLYIIIIFGILYFIYEHYKDNISLKNISQNNVHEENNKEKYNNNEKIEDKKKVIYDTNIENIL